MHKKGMCNTHPFFFVKQIIKLIMNYFIIRNGQQMGPYTIEQLRTMGLPLSTPIWSQGFTNWRVASEISELQGYLVPDAPPQYKNLSDEIGLFDDGPSGKSRGLAGLFAILLGTLGIHYFYIGKIAGGIITIILSIITCGIWNIINIIVGIKMLTMKQPEFEEKYVNTPSTLPLF